MLIKERYPIVILDGPDGVGKTTLANKLCEELGAKYIHLTYRWPAKMFDYHTAAMYYCLRASRTQPVVLDRWWPSEVVYANAYRGGSKWPLAYRMFEKAALRFGMTYVFCLPEDKDAYLAHFNVLKGKRTEMYDEGMERVYDGFKELYVNLQLSGRHEALLYDFMQDGQNMNEAVQKVIEASFDRLRVNPDIFYDQDFLNVTGSFTKADFLLVGDVSNPKTRREVMPFFDYGHSSLFLAQTLHDLGVAEHRLIFVNAGYRQQDKTNYLLKELSQVLPVIPMGNVAHTWVHQLGIKVVDSIRHPQYYKRFDREKFAVDLKRALKLETL